MSQIKGQPGADTTHRPKPGGRILAYCDYLLGLTMQNRVYAGNGLRAQRSKNGVTLSTISGSLAPIPFTESAAYFDGSQAKLDLYNGHIFWAGSSYDNSAAPAGDPDTSTLDLSSGQNQVYVNLDWDQASPAVTFGKLSGTSTPSPTVNNYRHWLGTWYVNATTQRIHNTYLCHSGGNIYIPGAFGP